MNLEHVLDGRISVGLLCLALAAPLVWMMLFFEQN